ncbi:hypothetical protein MHM39_05570 [Phaeobacter sp. CNT1-3]|nr:hypothetical protein [Phaeobacter sp. CNT1-3]
MTETAEVYQRAVELINKAEAKSWRWLSFPREVFENLTELPSSISKIRTLRRLDISQTSVSRLPNLGGLVNLKELDAGTGYISSLESTELPSRLKKIWLNGNSSLQEVVMPLWDYFYLEGIDLDDTSVSNVFSLASFVNLSTLRLQNTPVRNLEPIQELQNLTRLDLSGSDVLDLRPLLPLEQLAENPSGRGLTFENCAATRTDPKIAQIAEISDAKERAIALFHYLETGGGSLIGDYSATPYIPSRHPAPLETEIVNGRLVRSGAVNLSPPSAMQRAEMGWQALRAYTDSFAASFNIGNYAPLPGILLAFQNALGDTFDPNRQVSIGVFGSRVISLSRNQEFLHCLPTGADTDLKGFAAQIALYMDRFPDWSSYQAEAAASLASMERVTREKAAFTDLSDSLLVSAETNQDVAEEFANELSIAIGPEGDEESATALVASTRETLRTLGENAVNGIKNGQLIRDSVTGMDGIADNEVAKLKFWAGGWTLVLLKRNERPLRRLADRFPERLGWVAPVLDYLCRQTNDHDPKGSP